MQSAHPWLTLGSGYLDFFVKLLGSEQEKRLAKLAQKKKGDANVSSAVNEKGLQKKDAQKKEKTKAKQK